jgi:hypothetical protein
MIDTEKNKFALLALHAAGGRRIELQAPKALNVDA